MVFKCGDLDIDISRSIRIRFKEFINTHNLLKQTTPLSS